MRGNSKYAVCFSGMPRHLEDCHRELLDNVIRALDADVFAHFWYGESSIGSELAYSPWAVTQLIVSKERMRAGVPDLVQKLYGDHLVSMRWEAPRQFDMTMFEGAEFEQQTPGVLPSMWYSIREANELKRATEEKRGRRYDVVFRMRFDLEFRSPAKNLVDLLESAEWNQADAGTASTPKYVLHSAAQRQPNDWVLCSNSAVMDEVCSVYDNLISYRRDDHMTLMVNEAVLEHHLRKRAIRPIALRKPTLDALLFGRLRYPGE